MLSLESLLIENGSVAKPDIERAKAVSEQTGTRLGATLVRLGMISESDLAHQQSDALELDFVHRAELPSSLVIPGINPRFLERHGIWPISVDEQILRLAVADAQDEEALAAMAFAAGVASVMPVMACYSDIYETIAQHFTDDVAIELSPNWLGSSGNDDVERVLESDSEAPIIRLVQRLLTSAVDRRASDIHVEPMARQVVIRFRIDGQLIEVERHPDQLAGPIASRIKIMAGLDIAETRLPQDGRLHHMVRGRHVDVRVATSPIASGEAIVLRLLGRSEVPLDLDQLGLPTSVLRDLKSALARPHGIILLTGPTGSGKTTTLYAAINRLKRPEVKVLTVEDPVEVLLEGVNQVQVRPEIDLTYAAALRAFLRQDPDILMIGEIRDQETAEIAMRAALTGHLVLSTLHTNSALGAFTRLADIGVEPFLTASTVIAAIAQRLVRALCSLCASARPPSAPERRLFAKYGIEAPAQFNEPGGCDHCANSGYRGRLPVMEIVTLDDKLRAAVRDNRVADVSLAPQQTLYAHGLALVAAGRTSLAEIQRTLDEA